MKLFFSSVDIGTSCVPGPRELGLGLENRSAPTPNPASFGELVNGAKTLLISTSRAYLPGPGLAAAAFDTGLSLELSLPKGLALYPG